MLHRNSIRRGMAVRYIGENGFPIEVERADKFLNKKVIYTVSSVFEDVWDAYVYLHGVPNQSFRCSMFADADDASPEEAVTVPESAPKRRTVTTPPKKKKVSS